ncbi:MAG TPA: hypothetical protein ENI23_14075 [bacterium]|nr:hypothetical protein [bacterium]
MILTASGILYDLSPKVPGEASFSDKTGLPMVSGRSLLPISPTYSSFIKERAFTLAGEYGGQCVFFVQQFLKIFQDCNIVDCEAYPFRGYAGDIIPNSNKPEIGSAVLLAFGHTAVIIDIVGDELELAESNYSYDEIIKVGRKIKKTDEKIIGYFNFNIDVTKSM